MPDPTTPSDVSAQAAEDALAALRAEGVEIEADAQQRAPTAGDAAPVEPEATSPAPARSAELEAAVDDLRDRLLRAHAEMENLRRRTEREVQDARRYAVASFARDMLSVADNLRRALDAAAAGAADGAGDPVLGALVEGVELTERELQKALDKSGVQKLDPMGKMFDPHRHEAVFEAPDLSVPSGTVVQVMQAGYVIGDRILRPAMVAVARGGPKPSAADAQPGLDKSA